MNKTLDMIKGEYKIMDQKVLAVVGGHEITDKEVDAFIKSLPREQQAYASNPQFRAQCQEQLEALYSFAKYGEDLVEKAKNQKLDPVIGRDNEIRNVKRYSCTPCYEAVI